MTYEGESQLPLFEQMKSVPEEFGLRLENSDERRSIFSIQDEAKFFSKARELGVSVEDQRKISELFSQYPDGLKQFFIVNQPPEGKSIRLGDHYHTNVEKGGSGTEVFIFTDVPVGTDIKLERYSLGRATGQLRYGVNTGAVMINRPDDYHVFQSSGPFRMVQILEGKFNPNDLKKFDIGDWSSSDSNLIYGHHEDSGR
jgi:hypothetical protein